MPAACFSVRFDWSIVCVRCLCSNWPKLVIRHIREKKKFKIGQECLLLEQPCILTKKVKAILFPCFRSGSNPCIRRNKIWGGQNGGVLVYNGGNTLVSYEKEPVCG